MQQHAVRLPDAPFQPIREATKRKGFAPLSGFSQYEFIQECLTGMEPTRHKSEGGIEGTHGSITTVRVRRHTIQRAPFAFAGALAKTVLTDISERFHASLRCIERSPGGDGWPTTRF